MICPAATLCQAQVSMAVGIIWSNGRSKPFRSFDLGRSSRVLAYGMPTVQYAHCIEPPVTGYNREEEEVITLYYSPFTASRASFRDKDKLGITVKTLEQPDLVLAG